jgi:2-oxoglutarate dehydrogenase complex dehydrogenase (E1) component-like enzyme
MHRYSDMSYLMAFDIDEVMEMYLKAKKENVIEQLWAQWLIDYSRMDKESFTSFEDYKRKAFKVENNVELDKEKILTEAEEIKEADQKNRCKGVD